MLSSDRPASEIANPDQRLVSRLECGLTTGLRPPDLQTRMAILRKKAEGFHIELAQDILAFLAQRVGTNIRRLEGSIDNSSVTASNVNVKSSAHLERLDSHR